MKVYLANDHKSLFTNLYLHLMVNKIWGYCYGYINDVLLNLATELNIYFPCKRWQVKNRNSKTAYDYNMLWQCA